MDELVAVVSKGKDIAGIFIAALAFALALWTAWIQRAHNRLSVRPLPEVRMHDLETEVKVRLLNNGNGPLIVKTLLVVRDGQGVGDQLVECMPKQAVTWRFFVGPIDGRSLRAGDELTLLHGEYGLHGLELGLRQPIREALGALTVRITYTDIYGREFPPYEKDLSWFRRTAVHGQRLRS